METIHKLRKIFLLKCVKDTVGYLKHFADLKYPYKFYSDFVSLMTKMRHNFQNVRPHSELPQLIKLSGGR